MEYADREGFHGMDRDDLLYLIRTMDSAYLKHSKEESDRTLEKGKKKGGKIGGG